MRAIVFRELQLLSRFCESLLAELQVDVIAMSFACALCLCCVLRSVWLCQMPAGQTLELPLVKSAAAPSPTPRREEAYDRPPQTGTSFHGAPDKTRLQHCKLAEPPLQKPETLSSEGRSSRLKRFDKK